MPRNGSGTYSLPAGNPVTSGTLIEAAWANTTLSDLSAAMTDSLARSGEGGMTGPLRATDGSVSVPSVSFANETSTGFYRAGATDVRFAMSAVDIATLTTAGLTVGSSKVLSLPDGTAAAPALTNTGDTNTGVFFPDADTVAVSTGGSERIRVDGNGLSIGDGTAAAPSLSNIGDTNTGVFFPDTDTVAVSTAGAERVRVNSNGNLLVGATSDIGYKLHVGSGYSVSDTTARAVAFLGSTDTAASGSAPSGLFATYTGSATASARKVDLTVGTLGSGTYGELSLNSGAATLNSTGNLTLNKNFVLSGSSARIQGDFSNGTVTNRTSFQDATTNGTTSVNALPNGTATTSGWVAFNNSNPTNAGYAALLGTNGEVQLISNATGSGTVVQLGIYVGSTLRFKIQTDGAFVFYDNAGTRTASLDSSGNFIAKGNIIQNGTP